MNAYPGMKFQQRPIQSFPHLLGGCPPCEQSGSKAKQDGDCECDNIQNESTKRRFASEDWGESFGKRLQTSNQLTQGDNDNHRGNEEDKSSYGSCFDELELAFHCSVSFCLPAGSRACGGLSTLFRLPRFSGRVSRNLPCWAANGSHPVCAAVILMNRTRMGRRSRPLPLMALQRPTQQPSIALSLLSKATAARVIPPGHN